MKGYTSQQPEVLWTRVIQPVHRYGNRCSAFAARRPVTRRPAMRRAKRGIALIELALVSPIMLAMLLGIIDFGLLQRNTLVITNAAREGARAASLGQPTESIRARIASGGVPILRSDASNNPTNGAITMEHAVASTGTLSYQSWPNDRGSGTSQKNGVPQGNYVRITVRYDHRSITNLFNRSMTVPVTMRQES